MKGDAVLQKLANQLVLGDLLNALNRDFGGFEIVAHWSEGELHHDLVLRVDVDALGGEVLVVGTNCNGGVKELVSLDGVPDPGALWRWRCPSNPRFEGTLDDIRGVARTIHWVEPESLLT